MHKHCPVCDLPKANRGDWKHGEVGDKVCYSRTARDCAGRAVDWRKRALATELLAVQLSNVLRGIELVDEEERALPDRWRKRVAKLRERHQQKQ